MDTILRNPRTLRGGILDPRFVWIFFAIFVLLRLAIVLLVPITPASDAAWYFHRASELAMGEGYHEGPYPTAFWPIGYPAFLAGVFWVTGITLLSAKLANLALSCGIFFLTYRIGRRVFKSELGARCAILLLTIYPNQIAYTGDLLSEILLTFLLLLAIDVFTARPSYFHAFLAALIFGLSALVKAQALLLPAVLLGLYGWHIRRERGYVKRISAMLAIFAVGMGIAILPWTARNYAVFHQFVLVSTNGGTTLLTGNNPEARGDYTENNSLSPLARQSVADQVAADKRATKLAIDWIRQNPDRFVELIPLKIWRLWAPDGEGEWAFQLGYPSYEAHVLAFRAIRVLNQIFYVATLCGFVIAILMLRRNKEMPSAWVYLGLLLTLYTTAISVVFSGQSRFHFPVMPWVFMYVGWAIDRWITARSPNIQAQSSS